MEDLLTFPSFIGFRDANWQLNSSFYCYHFLFPLTKLVTIAWGTGFWPAATVDFAYIAPAAIVGLLGLGTSRLYQTKPSVGSFNFGGLASH